MAYAAAAQVHEGVFQFLLAAGHAHLELPESERPSPICTKALMTDGNCKLARSVCRNSKAPARGAATAIEVLTLRKCHESPHPKSGGFCKVRAWCTCPPKLTQCCATACPEQPLNSALCSTCFF